MTRKLVTLLLTLAMVLMMVPAIQVSAEDETTTIEWYFGVNATNVPDTDMVNDAINEYLDEKIGGVHVHMNFWGLREDWDRMTTMISAGQDCGIIGFGSQTRLDYVITSQRGGYYPIEDMLNEYPDTKALFDDAVWQAMTINGHIYGIPSKKDNGYFMSLVYNTNMANELGIDVNSFEFNNMQDAEKFAYEVKEKRDAAHPDWADDPVMWEMNALHPYYFAIENFITKSYFAVCNIPEIMQIADYDTDTVFNIYGTPEFLTFAQNKQKAVDDGIYLYDYADKNQIIYDGHVFGGIGYGYTYGSKRLFNTDKVDTDIRMFDKMWTDTSNFFSAGTAISSHCATPEKAMAVLNQVNTDPKLATMLRCGIEGVHYTYDKDGKMTFEGTRNADPENYGYFFWYMAPVGNLMIVDAPEEFTGPDRILLTNMAKYNDECIKAAHLGFVFDQSVVQNEVAALINVESEFSFDLVSGRLADADDVANTIDEFNAKLSENGLEKVIAEVQSQIDAWKAAR